MSIEQDRRDPPDTPGSSARLIIATTSGNDLFAVGFVMRPVGVPVLVSDGDRADEKMD